ncbi:MAG: tetratricopeptide repeat protein, partial [Planctomycetes bacterium]|nr:tetratricopeptide repeat protein [Planctomycetota bacterium]
MIALATCGLVWLAAQQAPQGDSVFVKKVIPGQDGAAERIVVAADKRSIDCLSALRQLAETMNWNIDVESSPLENDLRGFAVDLNLEDQQPRVVAQLVAVAGGADVVFDEAQSFAGSRPTLHVLRTPSAETESGRQRLRAMAGQWYRSFLRDELKYEPVVQRESVQVRLNLGQLLVESGDLESAIAFFTAAYEQRPHDHVGQAILRIADCHLDLAAGHADRGKQKAEYAKAEEWVRRILDNMPSSPEVTGATIRLGRAMLGQATAETQPDAVRQRAERCQDELRARVIRLLDSAEMVDVWLLSGQAQFLMERPDRVLETMLTLRESPWFGDMQERQFRDYHFLLGYGALGSGKHELS